MIAAVSAAVSPRLSHRLSLLAVLESSTSRVARGMWCGSASAHSSRVRMGRGIWLLFVGLVILSSSVAAGAQQATPARPAPWRVYFGGSALLSSQPGGSAEVPGEPGLGGTGLGLSALVGAGGRVGLEAEVTRGASLSSTWQDRLYGVSTYSTSYRDTLVSAFVRWRANPGGSVAIEPVGGVTVAFGRGTLATDFQPPSGSSGSAYTDTEHFSRTSMGLGGGLDVVVPVSTLVSIAGSARLHRLIWNYVTPYSASQGGVGTALGGWIVQFGGGVQVSWTRSPLPEAHLVNQAKEVPSGMEAPRARGYAGGTLMVWHQPDGNAYWPYLSAPLGGAGAGFSGIVGGFISRDLSIEAEVGIGPSLAAEQWFKSGTRSSTKYRDTLLSGFVRWHGLRFTRFAIEPVGGLTIAVGHAARTARDYQMLYPWEPLGPPYDASVTRITFGIGGGVDLVFPASKNLAVTGSLRLHALPGRDEPTELGIGPWIYQFGGGVRWNF